MAIGDSGTTVGVGVTSSPWTAEQVRQFEEITRGFSDKLSTALHDPMFMLFTSMFGLWIVITGYRLIFNMADINEVIRSMIFITITAVLLGSQVNALIPRVFTATLDIMGETSEVAFDVAGGNESSVERDRSYSGLPGLAVTVERSIAKVFKVAQAVSQAGSLFNIINYLYALAIFAPYILMMVVYACQIVVAIYRAMMVAIFSPFLFSAFAFGWGRPMFWAGARTLLGSVVVLFGATCSVALAVYGVSLIEINPETFKDSETLNDFTRLTNPKFLAILALGWIATGLMTEGVSLANSFIQTALTNTAVGVMTAGAMATGGFLAKQAGNVAGHLGKLGGMSRERLWGGAEQAAQNHVNKFKNINGGGGE